MTFLNPAYLWALLGLAVPLAIHLWSKREGRIIKTGSIRFLTESYRKQSSSVKFNELLLLLLRLLIITVLVLILAEPLLKNEDSNAPVAYFIEPSLLEHEKVKKIADSLEEFSTVRFFSEGFREYAEGNHDQKSLNVPDYWQLARKIETFPADSIVVFTNAYQKGFKGKIPEIQNDIRWIVIDSENAEPFYAEAVKTGDSVEIISIAASNQNLEVRKENLALNSSKFRINEKEDSISVISGSVPQQLLLQNADTLHVSVFYTEDLRDEMKYIKSSFSAIGRYVNRPLKVQSFKDKDRIKNSNPAALIWLSEDPPVQTNAPMLIFKEDSLSEELVVHGSSRYHYQLTKKLNSENILTGNLQEKLVSILNLHPGLKEKLLEMDSRVMEVEELLPLKAGLISEEKITAGTALTKYFWILLLILTVAERGVAAYRKQ